jgi:hydroxymethylglutaryl-CoA lyase
MRVEIVEVGPRDGLQNEKVLLSPEDKAELIRRSTAAGLRRVESVSFVSSKAVPQMAGAEEVMALTERVPGVSYIGLVLNLRGLTRAIEAGMDEVNVVLVASDTFSQRNQGATIGEMVGRWRQIVAEANGAVPLSVTIAAAFGCPFEGEVDPELVARLAGEAYDGGAVEIALADTIGVGVPAQVRDLAERVRNAAPDIPLRAHFHNTRNTGYANAFAAAEAGIEALDASTGGYGGCPFAPNATGNIATEDLAYGFHRSGIDTGVDAAMVCETATWLSGLLGKAPPALLGRAGFFPPEDSRPTPVVSREGVPA